MCEKKPMRHWDKERIDEVVAKNLPRWSIVEYPSKITALAKIKLLCERGHENEKRLSIIANCQSLGCKECIRIEQATECFNKFTELLENESWKMNDSIETLLKSDKSFVHTKTLVICPNGKKQYKTYAKFSSGSRCNCKICRPRGANKGKTLRKWTQEKIEEFYSERNLIFKDTYKTTHDKYTTECAICGYGSDGNWKPRATSIIHGGTGCPVCSGKIETLETFSKWVKEHRPYFEVIQEQEYINSDTKVKICCIHHDDIFEITPSALKKGHNGCPVCNSERQSEVSKKLHETYYFDNSRENNPLWKGGITQLSTYFRNQLTEWKKWSMKHFDYKCFITGRAFEDIHHMNGFNDIVMRTMEIVNLPIHENISMYSDDELETIRLVCLKLHVAEGFGVPLTNDIHKEFHSIYGRGGNTIDQFIDFLEDKGLHAKAKQLTKYEIARRRMLKLNRFDIYSLIS